MGGAVAVAGALPAALAAGHVIWTGRATEIRWPWSVPFGSFYVAVDGLSAFFIMAIAVICGLAAVYGVAYMREYAGRKNLGVSWFFYNVLFASMLVVVAARNGVLFLVAWEIMSLASFFLVMFEHERKEVREAGWTYLAATHLGTAFLLALFMLLGWQGKSMDFDRFGAAPGVASAGVLFVLAVVGFGTKAGFMPMHVWLPEAHPAAPSHVSAVMSGVMIKTGIYGLLRTLTFLGPPEAWPSWWGWTLIGIGAVSGVGGVLFALAQHDLKRLLAYHSVENIGIICLGLGLWLLGTSTGNPTLAALGLMGGLLHVWNHAIFKSLLFLGAGAVAHATGTRDIEQLGGLLKRMRLTGIAFLVGSAAICGLPPLNGFVSEFLLYVGAFHGVAQAGQSQAAVAGLVTVAALALIGGLAVACFTKVCGIVFLGEGRSAAAGQAHEVSAVMRVPMAALAALCVLIGLLGPVVVGAVEPLTAGLLPARTLAIANVDGLDVAGLLWRVSAAFAVMLAVGGGLWLLRRRLLAGRVVEQTGTWDCGYAAPTARMQYTASSFAWPILDMFRLVLRPRLHRRLPSGLFPERADFESHTEDIFRRYGYGPAFRSAAWLADRLRWVQQGRNQLYVLYIALTLLTLLLWKLGVAR
jgi:formate hydrogenlyase subunit 3/multisubunit Na+/H+ antiporter MnhD subunit